ncbi:MAG TPA: hypothetical protein VD689_05465 [Nitrosopumilaceae archaeon]|nr:hypothetical protein [Nitrosopumilaceae archaeon]
MNCRRCHHTYEAHQSSQESTSILKLGKCQIPHCTCREYLDAMNQIDEELL